MNDFSVTDVWVGGYALVVPFGYQLAKTGQMGKTGGVVRSRSFIETSNAIPDGEQGFWDAVDLPIISKQAALRGCSPGWHRGALKPLSGDGEVPLREVATGLQP